MLFWSRKPAVTSAIGGGDDSGGDDGGGDEPVRERWDDSDRLITSAGASGGRGDWIKSGSPSQRAGPS